MEMDATELRTHILKGDRGVIHPVYHLPLLPFTKARQFPARQGLMVLYTQAYTPQGQNYLYFLFTRHTPWARKSP